MTKKQYRSDALQAIREKVKALNDAGLVEPNQVVLRCRIHPFGIELNSLRYCSRELLALRLRCAEVSVTVVKNDISQVYVSCPGGRTLIVPGGKKLCRKDWQVRSLRNLVR